MGLLILSLIFLLYNFCIPEYIQRVPYIIVNVIYLFFNYIKLLLLKKTIRLGYMCTIFASVIFIITYLATTCHNQKNKL